MKRLTCEMCGSTDLVKQDGMFVCQTCGTKYSVEEAKKMMIEGNVDVSGSTVKVDSSEELDNLYQIARRARDDNNSESAAKYYDMILVKDPRSWEASFYSVYFRAMTCKIAQIRSAAVSVSNCIKSVMELIRDNVNGSDAQEQAVADVSASSIRISRMLFEASISHFDGINSDIRGNYYGELLENCDAARDIMCALGNGIDSTFDNKDIKIIAAFGYEGGINLTSGFLKKARELAPTTSAYDNFRVFPEGVINQLADSLYCLFENCDKSEDDILDIAIDKLETGNVYVAKALFKCLGAKADMKAIGYLGEGSSLALSGFFWDEINCGAAFSKAEELLSDEIEKKYSSQIRRIVNAATAGGVTPLMVTANHRYVEESEFLLRLGADVNAKSSGGVTPLWFIAYKQKDGKASMEVKLAKAFLEAGAETNIVSEGNVSLLNERTHPQVKALIMEKNPDTKMGQAPARQSSGCYVATAVYGSYDCPEVWTLRRYRDYELAETWYGRAFIRTYYAISPTLVKWFGDKTWFKTMWRSRLDHMVKELHEKGFESTPYQDRNW